MSSKLARAVGSGAYFWKMVMLHVVGGLLGGAALGALLAIGSLIGTRYPVFLVILVLYAWSAALTLLASWDGRKPRVPWVLERKVQVSGWHQLPKAAWVWGLQLGLGIASFAVTPLLHLFFVYSMFLGPASALILGIVYGVGRTMTHGVAAAILRRVNGNAVGLGFRSVLGIPAGVTAILITSLLTMNVL